MFSLKSVCKLIKVEYFTFGCVVFIKANLTGLLASTGFGTTMDLLVRAKHELRLMS